MPFKSKIFWKLLIMLNRDRLSATLKSLTLLAAYSRFLSHPNIYLETFNTFEFDSTISLPAINQKNV